MRLEQAPPPPKPWPLEPAPPETEGFAGHDLGYLVNSFGGGNNDITEFSSFVFVQ